MIPETETPSGQIGADLARLYMRRLERCTGLRSSWRYVRHGETFQTLLDRVAELSYRDYVRHGLKNRADVIIGSAAAPMWHRASE
ncbi:MAG TPA: hypothetical protein VHX16_11365 [Chloroflexota bacterium]|nr:hypothetical protein [Chloroflexota bacterium]